MALLQFLLSLSILVVIGHAQFQPSAVPLLVRSPYFNSWVAPNASASQPQFWGGNRTLGWNGFIRVDGSVYSWMGSAFNDFNDGDLKFDLGPDKDKAPAKVEGVTITPTRTIYSLSAGPMRFNFTFLSPIEPNNLVLQSFPFGYVYVDAISSDGNTHSVQIYSDLSGEWLSDDSSDTISWGTQISASMVFHSAERMPSDKLANTYMAQDGILYHATLASADMTWQTGNKDSLQSWFLTQGSLNLTQDTQFRRIDDQSPVFAFANDLGTISATSQPVLWAIGYARAPVVRYTNSEELQPYWTTKYSRIDDAIQAFLNDFPSAKARAESLDDRILSEARTVSPDYADLVSLSARQTFGGVETTVSPSGSAWMFMKDVGTTGRVNPVEIIYASFPAYLYINATWCRYLLEPLFEYQKSSLYTINYAAPDLGVNYPIAQGGSANLLRSIEDSGSMLIMTWAHARFSGDQSILNTYFDTLKKWTDYLISTNALATSGYQDADGLTATNLTNLALKGIIGVRAMAEISHTLGRGDDTVKYQNQAATWIKQWEQSANVNGHLVSSYNSGGSWGMIYNLFADKLLGMNLVSREIYDAQDRFYNSLVQSGNKFGLPFDSSVNVAKSHWTMLTAATANAVSARDSLLRGVYAKAVDISQFTPFPSTYNTQDGEALTGWASPAQGAAFGLLAMGIKSRLVGLSGNTIFGSEKKSIGAQVGIGVGVGVASLVLIALGFLLWRRRKNHTHARGLSQKESKMATFFRFGRGPNDSIEETLADNCIEPYTTQKSQLQNQPSSPHASRKRYRPDRKVPRKIGEQTDLEAASNSRRDVPPRSGEVVPPSSSAGARSAYSNFTHDVSSLRNAVEHLRRNILELQSRVYGPPPSYRTTPSSRT
ncbi:hypothetical protein VNI00_007593 [Paramarasmius palmivorus]|uniref:DUF1793-domain-containing protein n=1 Tax=Paramarasmius palmivorus TaxID=297713 RepID=A0AAW0D210_9AGAR